MTDETVQPIVGDGAVEQGGEARTPEWVRDPARAYAEIQAARREAAEARAKLRKLEKRIGAEEAANRAEAENQLADQQQWKMLADQRAAEVEALRAELSRVQRDLLVGSIARDLNLPPAIAARLQGTTEEEIRADAEALKKELSASIFSRPGASTSTTAIPGGSSVELNEEQLRREYFGGGGGGRETRPPGAAGPGEQTVWRFGG